MQRPYVLNQSHPFHPAEDGLLCCYRDCTAVATASVVRNAHEFWRVELQTQHHRTRDGKVEDTAHVFCAEHAALVATQRNTPKGRTL